MSPQASRYFSYGPTWLPVGVKLQAPMWSERFHWNHIPCVLLYNVGYEYVDFFRSVGEISGVCAPVGIDPVALWSRAISRFDLHPPQPLALNPE